MRHQKIWGGWANKIDRYTSDKGSYYTTLFQYCKTLLFYICLCYYGNYLYWMTRRDRKGRAASQKRKFVSFFFCYIFICHWESLTLVCVYIFLCPSSRLSKGEKKKEIYIRRVMDMMRFLECDAGAAETIPICCPTTPCPITIKRSGWKHFNCRLLPEVRIDFNRKTKVNTLKSSKGIQFWILK